MFNFKHLFNFVYDKKRQMVKPTIIYDSHVHREKSSDIDGHEEIASLAANMKETLKNAGGQGMEASQTG